MNSGSQLLVSESFYNLKKYTESLKEFGVCGLYILLFTVLEEIFRTFNIFKIAKIKP